MWLIEFPRKVHVDGSTVTFVSRSHNETNATVLTGSLHLMTRLTVLAFSLTASFKLLDAAEPTNVVFIAFGPLLLRSRLPQVSLGPLEHFQKMPSSPITPPIVARGFTTVSGAIGDNRLPPTSHV